MQETIAMITLLKGRFDAHPEWQGSILWPQVEARLRLAPAKLASLEAMEQSGGEVALLSYDPDGDHYLFFDCAPESPQGRRSLCYDEEARRGRRDNAPASSAQAAAEAMGVELLDEQQYRFLQGYGPFDQKSSSWIKTPQPVRSLGGALFGDWRYGRTFIYHNGAQSYYSGRGFRTLLRV